MIHIIYGTIILILLWQVLYWHSRYSEANDWLVLARKTNLDLAGRFGDVCAENEKLLSKLENYETSTPRD